MKAYFIPFAVAGVFLLSLSACSKSCSTCVLNNNSTEYCQGQFSQSQIDAFKNSCVNNGGTWQ
ncbi:MAG: hypothetical protein KA149_07660 [Chitinophagales bacterium]|nr:hypothetical protein [Chitinophagales bacterium]